MRCFHRSDSKQVLLAWLSCEMRVSPDRIASTSAFQNYRDTGDSLDVVELIMALEEEMAGDEPADPAADA